MMLFAVVTSLAAVAVGSAWFAARLVAVIKSDGYGFRAASGLPRDWAPSDTQSTPYSEKPHF